MNNKIPSLTITYNYQELLEIIYICIPMTALEIENTKQDSISSKNFKETFKNGLSNLHDYLKLLNKFIEIFSTLDQSNSIKITLTSSEVTQLLTAFECIGDFDVNVKLEFLNSDELRAAYLYLTFYNFNNNLSLLEKESQKPLVLNSNENTDALQIIKKYQESIKNSNQIFTTDIFNLEKNQLKEDLKYLYSDITSLKNYYIDAAKNNSSIPESLDLLIKYSQNKILPLIK